MRGRRRELLEEEGLSHMCGRHATVEELPRLGADMKDENADGFTAIIVGKDRFKRTDHAGEQARVALGGRRRDQPRHARRRCVDGVDRQQPMGARLLCVMVALSLSAAVNLPTELRRPRLLPMP